MEIALNVQINLQSYQIHTKILSYRLLGGLKVNGYMVKK